MAAHDPLASRGKQSTANAAGQSRTALVSIAAAAVLVVLKLGTGIVDRQPRARLRGHRVLAATSSPRS